MRQVIVNEATAHETQDFLHKRLQAIKNQRSSGDNEDLALVIGELENKLRESPLPSGSDLLLEKTAAASLLL